MRFEMFGGPKDGGFVDLPPGEDTYRVPIKLQDPPYPDPLAPTFRVGRYELDVRARVLIWRD